MFWQAFNEPDNEFTRTPEEITGERRVEQCSSACYTVGAEVTNGQIVVSNLTDLTWIQRYQDLMEPT